MGKLSKYNKDSPGMHKGWRVVDDYTGFYEYSSTVTRDYLGLYTRPELADSKHPQELVVSRDVERPLPYVRPEQPDIYVGWLTDEDL